MSRTSVLAVQTLLGPNYNPTPQVGDAIDLQQYIDTANSVVTQLVSKASGRGITVDSGTAELIERWLSAHFYTKTDPVYTSKSTLSASGSFVRDSETPEPYKAGALNLDSTGILNSILNGKRARSFWIGKSPEDQIPAAERVTD